MLEVLDNCVLVASIWIEVALQKRKYRTGHVREHVRSVGNRI
ncbi:hypothetical protein [Prevotella sp. HMSC077E09]|nr:MULTISPECIES: hypothetical protein [unclassified Prevotella]